MRITARHALPALLLASLALIPACSDDTMTTALSPELQQLKEKTAPYQDITAAETAGWDTPITPCWYDHTAGGMGYHYAKATQIDGTVSALDPEVLIYEPKSDGAMQLVGMEYIVPIDAWSGSGAPSLFGQEYIRFDDFGIYALHVYLWKDNPSGMFAPWNPDISCQYAEESQDLAPGASVKLGHDHGAE
jgi:hypothetical protein